MHVRISKYLVLISFIVLSSIALYVNFDKIKDIYIFSTNFQNLDAKKISDLHTEEKIIIASQEINRNNDLAITSNLISADTEVAEPIGTAFSKDDIVVHQDVMLIYFDNFILSQDIDMNNLDYSIDILRKIKNEKLFSDMKKDIETLILNIKKLQSIKPVTIFPKEFVLFNFVESLFKITYLPTEKLENQKKIVISGIKAFKADLYKKERIAKIFEDR